MLNVCILLVLSALLPHFTDGYVEVQPYRSTIPKEIGDTFKSYCTPHNGTKDIRWSFGSQTLGTQESGRLKLEIENVNFSSQGTYVCSNSDDSEKDSVTLVVYKRPTFDYMQNQTLTFGKTEQILCGVESENTTEYEWKMNGRNLQRSQRINIMENEYLEIKEVNENDAGVYECISTITNQYIVKPYSVYINVVVTGQPVRTTVFISRIPNAESTNALTEPKGQTATALSPTRIPNAETTRPITHTTEPKGKPSGPTRRPTGLSNANKGKPSGPTRRPTGLSSANKADSDDPDANSGGEGKILYHMKFVNRNLGLVLVSIISMLILTVP